METYKTLDPFTEAQPREMGELPTFDQESPPMRQGRKGDCGAHHCVQNRSI